MADAQFERLNDAIDAVVARRDATAALSDPALAPLVRIAAELRHYPGASFKARLRAQLERRNPMTTAVLTNIREGFTTVTPYLWAPDRGLADFLVRGFGAVETRVAERGRHGTHRELRIGNSMLMLGEGAPGASGAPPRPMAFHLFVDDVDAVYARAVAAGGDSMGEPADRPYGERSGYVRDAYGNHWYVATPLGPQSVGHMLRSVTPFLHAPDVGGYMQFLTRAFAAVEEMRHEEPAGVMRYAQMRVGDAVLEFGPAEPMPGSFMLYVGDVDAAYDQAIAAGAKSLTPPRDQPDGDRMAFVEDPLGNQWFIATPKP